MWRYDAVLFDLYGTLVDIRTDESSDRAWSALRDALVAEGCARYRDVDDMRLRAMFDAASAPAREHAAAAHGRWAEPDLLDAYVRMIAVGDGAGGAADDAVLDSAGRVAWAFRQGSTRLLRLYPGAIDLLDALRDSGVRTVLVSNAQSCYTRPELDALGLSDRFDRIVISSEEGVRKPSAEIFRRVLEREGLQPEYAVMIGNDERSDILGARAAGIDGIYLRTEISPQSDPQSSDYALRSFAGADYAGILHFLALR